MRLGLKIESLDFKCYFLVPYMSSCFNPCHSKHHSRSFIHLSIFPLLLLEIQFNPINLSKRTPKTILRDRWLLWFQLGSIISHIHCMEIMSQTFSRNSLYYIVKNVILCNTVFVKSALFLLSIAFASAWTTKGYFVCNGSSLFERLAQGNDLSGHPRGNPLYPIPKITSLSSTIQLPTCSRSKYCDFEGFEPVDWGLWISEHWGRQLPWSNRLLRGSPVGEKGQRGLDRTHSDQGLEGWS